MSVPTEIADGPRGPEPIISISKRTATYILVGAAALIFSLLTIVWIMYSVYRDAHSDLVLIRSQNACARELNAGVVVVEGEYLQQLGALSEQIADTFAALPDAKDDPAPFFTSISQFTPIATEMRRLDALFDNALNNYQQVNDICAKGGVPTPTTTTEGRS